jgi:3',5'-cyclic AMP phosphodiesterase CpdA
MSVLLQISDPHFGTEQPPVVEALVALAQQQRPDLLVLSGDITQRARPAQFRAARAFMDRLGAPVLAVVRYEGDVHVLDDALSAQAWLSDQLIGVVINNVGQVVSGKAV